MRYSLSKNVLTLKSRWEVTQGHRKWYHSVDSLWFLLVFHSNFVRRCTIFEIFDFKNKYSDLQNWIRGPSMSLEMSPFDRTHTTSYWRSTVTMALSRVVSEIFNVEKCRDLKVRVRGHSRSSKVVPFDTLGMVSY